MPERDHQRARVYAWEEQFIAPRDQTAVAFARAQGVVAAIWADLGLRFPPKVERLPQQARCTMADATRLSIRLPQSSPSWLLLHELAHALSSTHDGMSDGHGPVFMGLYAQLLARYMRLPIKELCQSLAGAGIGVDLAAKPIFMDEDVTDPTLGRMQPCQHEVEGGNEIGAQRNGQHPSCPAIRV